MTLLPFAYLVDFVIVLWIVLEYLWLLLVIEFSSELIDTAREVFVLEFSPPLLAVKEPGYVSLKCTCMSSQV